MTPLGAAIVEMSTCRGLLFEEAVEILQDKFENDGQCPVSGLFGKNAVLRFYGERGVEINPVPLPRA